MLQPKFVETHKMVIRKIGNLLLGAIILVVYQDAHHSHGKQFQNRNSLRFVIWQVYLFTRVPLCMRTGWCLLTGPSLAGEGELLRRRRCLAAISAVSEDTHPGRQRQCGL